MSLPWATLSRHGQPVWLHDGLGYPPEAAAACRQIDFIDVGEAERWLSHWLGDAASLTSLRVALQKSEPSAPLHFWADQQVLARMAARLAARATVAFEAPPPASPPVMPKAPAPPAVAEPPAVPVSRLLAPTPTPAPALLPILEEVQIEGAEVLPEIEQSLEQVDLSIEQIGLAPVSLEPTPSKVPDIGKAMKQAGDSVQSELDKL